MNYSNYLLIYSSGNSKNKKYHAMHFPLLFEKEKKNTHKIFDLKTKKKKIFVNLDWVTTGTIYAHSQH